MLNLLCIFSVTACETPVLPIGTAAVAMSVDDPQYIATLFTPVPFPFLAYGPYNVTGVAPRTVYATTGTQMVLVGQGFTATGVRAATVSLLQQRFVDCAESATFKREQ